MDSQSQMSQILQPFMSNYKYKKMKDKILVVIFLMMASVESTIAMSTNATHKEVTVGYVAPTMVVPLDTTCKENDKNLYCDNILGVINITGGINSFYPYYDLSETSYADMAQLISFQDEYNGMIEGAACYHYIKSFYEVIGKEPKTFTKSLLKYYIFQVASKYPERFCEIAGWEYLQGNILPKDTSLGKQCLSFASGIPVDSLETYILPFWRDSISSKIYKQRHDSILLAHGKMRNDTLSASIIENGDTLAYRKMLLCDSKGHEMIYAVYMIDQYDYKSGFMDLYNCLKKRYTFDKQTMGRYALFWLCNIAYIGKIDFSDCYFRGILFEYANPRDEISKLKNDVQNHITHDRH